MVDKFLSLSPNILTVYQKPHKQHSEHLDNI